MDTLQYSGLWLLIALAFNMWGWLSVLQSDARPTKKVFWTIALIGSPGLGFLAWYLIGPRQTRA